MHLKVQQASEIIFCELIGGAYYQFEVLLINSM